MSDIIMPFPIVSGLYVLEGLDGTGKSTQIERLEQACYVDIDEAQLFSPTPVFTHSPSGGGEIGMALYDVTENAEIRSGWTRQFIHLACHSEMYSTLINPALKKGFPVFLDRCWWSAIAYGWFGNKKVRKSISLEEFERLVLLPTEGTLPDVVFLYMEPFVEDSHNTAGVREGYEYLADKYKDITERIDPGNPAYMKLQMMEALAARGIYRNGD